MDEDYHEKVLEFDNHLVKIAEEECGTKDHSEYARAVLAKAQTLMLTSANKPTIILDELNTA